MRFKAVLLDKSPDRGFSARMEDLEDTDLPPGEVAVEVLYSSLNYKDALALTDRAPVVRSWPMVPGIDLAGTVSADGHGLRRGDAVLLNGWGVGESHWGGLSQRARLKRAWLMPLPAPLSARQAMALGTAGYTAMLCAMALRSQGVGPGNGEILVTGAAGGVGSVAIMLMSAWGYRVCASTRRSSEASYLHALGAAEVLDAQGLAKPGRPLVRERWAGVIDTVGSHTLANACAATRYGGVVAACGLAQGMDLPGSVAPFILRAVKLVGIDSVMAPMALRCQAWEALAREVEPGKLETVTREIALGEVFDAASALLEGKLHGRTVVDVNR